MAQYQAPETIRVPDRVRGMDPAISGYTIRTGPCARNNAGDDIGGYLVPRQLCSSPTPSAVPSNRDLIRGSASRAGIARSAHPIGYELRTHRPDQGIIANSIAVGFKGSFDYELRNATTQMAQHTFFARDPRNRFDSRRIRTASIRSQRASESANCAKSKSRHSRSNY